MKGKNCKTPAKPKQPESYIDRDLYSNGYCDSNEGLFGIVTLITSGNTFLRKKPGIKVKTI